MRHVKLQEFHSELKAARTSQSITVIDSRRACVACWPKSLPVFNARKQIGTLSEPYKECTDAQQVADLNSCVLVTKLKQLH